jgi:ribosomal protein L11 methyltransferase
VPLTALVLDLDAEHAELLGDALLEAGALSIEYSDPQAGTPLETPVFDEPGEAGRWQRIRLTALLPADETVRSRAELVCVASGVDPGAWQLQSIEDTDWVRRSQEQFDPIRISDRLWIVPSWHEPPEPDAINLLLDPGAAFGTGSHPTTRLCLMWLEQNVRGGETVLDYGCGSGILAIAALKLGARHAVGVDIDPAAVAAARANAERNQVVAQFLDAQAPPTLNADIVVANILANPLKVLAPLLSACCRPGGKIALSGILAGQADEVLAIYSRWFDCEPPVGDGDWVCVSGTRK